MHKYLVEFLGTLLLSFSVFATGNYIVIGGALATAILLGGAISGGAFNPAITIAMMISNRLPHGDVIPYIIAQVFGGIMGYMTVQYSFFPIGTSAQS